jgi:hypothetical protein
VRQHERDQRVREGLTTDERKRLKDLLMKRWNVHEIA